MSSHLRLSSIALLGAGISQNHSLNIFQWSNMAAQCHVTGALEKSSREFVLADQFMNSTLEKHLTEVIFPPETHPFHNRARKSRFGS